jgi:hypothetical protein
MRFRPYRVDLHYTRDELQAIFLVAQQGDAEQGRGRYHARAAAIDVWSHHWGNPATKAESDLLGSFYVLWGDDSCIRRIDCGEGFNLEDLLVELGLLELQALGELMHGCHAV